MSMLFNKTIGYEYLTEKSLRLALEQIFPNNEIISNRKFKNYKFKPDYVIHDHKLVIEFDGYRHYNDAKTIINDEVKDTLIESEGYRMIRIPYFVQLTSEIVYGLFNEYIDKPFEYYNNFNDYPHGFVDKKAMLPANFCQLGIDKFKLNIDQFNNYDDIFHDLVILTIFIKIFNYGSIRTVMPIDKNLLDFLEFYFLDFDEEDWKDYVGIHYESQSLKYLKEEYEILQKVYGEDSSP